MDEEVVVVVVMVVIVVVAAAEVVCPGGVHLSIIAGPLYLCGPELAQQRPYTSDFAKTLVYPSQSVISNHHPLRHTHNPPPALFCCTFARYGPVRRAAYSPFTPGAMSTLLLPGGAALGPVGWAHVGAQVQMQPPIEPEHRKFRSGGAVSFLALPLANDDGPLPKLHYFVTNHHFSVQLLLGLCLYKKMTHTKVVPHNLLYTIIPIPPSITYKTPISMKIT